MPCLQRYTELKSFAHFLCCLLPYNVQGLRKAARFRTARLTYCRDALVNYLPTKLYGAQDVLLHLAIA